MDEHDIFQKLGFGIKFNTKRFKADAKRLNIIHEDKSDVSKQDKSELDFFKSKTKKTLESTKEEPLLQNVQHIRKQHKIFTVGTDVPDPLSSFNALKQEYDVDEKIIKNLVERMGFSSLTAIQMQAIPTMLQRREILASAPTGSGKTIAFLMPAIMHCMKTKTEKKCKLFKVLILSPTRELAAQTLEVCKQLTTTDASENRSNLINAKLLDKNIVKKIRDNKSKKLLNCDILISTPNRLVYLLNHDPPLISLKNVEWLIVDESDKLFEGEEIEKDTFREQLGTIYGACSSKNIRRAMFSATFAHDVQQWCQLNMDNVIEVNIGGKNTAVKSVKQKLLYTGNEHGKMVALRDILSKAFSPPVLLFVQSKERAKELFAELIYDGMNVDAIHADRTPQQRNNAVKCFRSGQTWILICTELMGRGVDFKAVNLVINYDLPNSAVSYIHRIGRTGRAGRTGEAITFFTDEDKPMLRSIANVIKEAGCDVPQYALELKKMGRKDRKKFSHAERKRKTIRTTPKSILEEAKKKKLNKEVKKP